VVLEEIPPLLAHERARAARIHVIGSGLELRGAEGVRPGAVRLELLDLAVQRVTLKRGTALGVEREAGDEGVVRRRHVDRYRLRAKRLEDFEHVERLVERRRRAVL